MTTWPSMGSGGAGQILVVKCKCTDISTFARSLACMTVTAFAELLHGGKLNDCEC